MLFFLFAARVWVLEKTKVCLISLGCPKNLVDSEIMLGHLAKDRYEIVTDEKQADIIIVNTCAFIKEAKEESVEAILEAAGQKSAGRCRLLAVCGCLPQRYVTELARELPEVDLFFGTGEVPRIAELLDRVEEEKKQVSAVGEPAFLYDHTTPRAKSSPFYSAYVKISEGCINCCSYCVIPKLRGTLRSREIPSVVEEVRSLVAGGVREINLIAQDITAFGRDQGRESLPDLLRELVRIDDLRWLRLLYAHPAGVTDELIELVAREDKICKYFDIPLQHINDEILARMNRRIDSQRIRELLADLRRRIPEVTLRTSFIVGFPGESDEQFAQLLHFVQEGLFDRVGVFRYSQEEGTPSAQFPDQIAARIKKLRFEKLMKAQKRVSFQKNRALVGKIEPVLIEGVSEETDLLLRGRHIRQAPDVDGQVYITAGHAAVGDIVPLRITDSSDYDLIGEIVEEVPCPSTALP
jgi:ribosomal protein S12 methylthiotransferase